MKHITHFKHNIERLEEYADINGWLPESLADFSAPYFTNATNLDPHCEDDYDALMLLVSCIRQEIARADGSAQKLVASLALNAWKHIED